MSAIGGRPYLIAAGGTGGHMFPALALANELIDRGLRVLLVTDARGARFLDQQLPHRLIQAGSPSGGIATRITGALRLAFGLLQSLAINIRHRPLAGACFGGYPSIPPGLAMALMRVPFLLHEQNALLGKANRILARYARKVALTFEPTEKTDAVMAERRLQTGNPVRPGFTLKTNGKPSDVFCVLILGGSQGARVFSDVVPEAIDAMTPELRSRLKLTQQCRPEDLERVKAAYASTGIEVELATFFGDVAERMAAADLIITRSGASTVTEILALGRPSILVPYAFAAEDHQRCNAERVAAEGAALTISQHDFDAVWLKERLETLIQAPSNLQSMAANAAAMAHPKAAERLADTLTSLHLQEVVS
ncbi:MAG: undecaprenyldiphospho-muramoylpentapeptide beta-N-acetylglucosaminyltransferase [Pseudomonadota bacterium]